MQNTQTQITPATCAPSADEIINDILNCDQPGNIREGLDELMFSFFMNERPTDEFKDRVYGNYRILRDALKKMERLNNVNELAA